MQVPKLTLVAILINQVAVRASMLSANGMMDWTVEDTELLHPLTTVLAARTLFRATMHFRHVVLERLCSRRGIDGEWVGKLTLNEK